MEQRDLRAFVVLGETLHFGQAAQRLHLTQSALSKQIQRLEVEWGGALFERGAAGTRLTALGRALLPDATRLLDDANRIARKASDVVAGISGCLRIGFGVATKTLVPLAIARFRALRPDVKIELFDMSTHHQIQAMIARTIDIGFCRMPAPEGWTALTVESACFVAVFSADCSRDPALDELARRPLATVARDRAPAFHDHLTRYLAGSGLRVGHIQPVSDFASAVALAAAGVAWAIVPSSTAIEDPLVRTLPLTAPEASWQIAMMKPPGAPDPLVDTFWSVVSVLCSHTAA